MDQENVELVRRLVDRINARDLAGVGALYDEEAVVFMGVGEGWPESGVYEGRDAILAVVGRIQEDFAEQEVVVEETEARGVRSHQAGKRSSSSASRRRASV